MVLYTELANLIAMGSEIGDEELACPAGRIEYITKELEEAGNYPGQLNNKILLMLKKAKSEIIIEEEMKLSMSNKVIS